MLARDYRPRDRSAEQVVAFVDRVRAHHRKDELAGEFLAQIFNIEFARPGLERLLLESVGFVALAGASILEGLILVSAIRDRMAHGIPKRCRLRAAASPEGPAPMTA